MAARDELEDYRPRRAVKRTDRLIIGTIPNIAPGEPPPGTPIQAPVEPQYVQPFNYQAPRFNAPSQRGGQSNVRPYNVPDAPQFYVDPFRYPSGEDLFEDPSYQSRLQEGLRAIERSAAARGTLRSGNTLQDLMREGQDYASREYAAAADRARQQYGLNFGASQAMYLPQYATWEARNLANRASWEEQQRARDLAYQRAWQEYAFGLDDEFRREQMLYSGGLGTYR